ncbi:hypothetical protein RR46_05014 [Papilio xuthus]|uniref:Uncharacterized protein n=1 Tax=Papilio xuthus TaxID=66420 RepID=A0A194PVV2_PAPXU|nr:hypothetical protein RR46_05014 [Papilio xuthus]
MLRKALGRRMSSSGQIRAGGDRENVEVLDTKVCAVPAHD